DVTAWHERLMKHVPRPEGFPVIVLGNKSDKPESAQQVSLEDGESFVAAKLPSASHLRTSAKENSNVETAFETIARAALARGASTQTTAAVPQQIKIDAPAQDGGGCAC
ncbi:gtp-14, partial [Symbiodinium sp. KB8]